MSKNGVFSRPYFPIFSPNTWKYGPEITPCLVTFHAVYFNIFRQRSTWYTIKKTISNIRLLIQRYAQFWFFTKGSGSSFSTTFCVYFSCYILLTDQISFSDWLYVLRYWTMCASQLIVFQVVTWQVLKLTLLF